METECESNQRRRHDRKTHWRVADGTCSSTLCRAFISSLPGPYLQDLEAPDDAVRGFRAKVIGRMAGLQDKGLDVRNNKVVKLGELPTPGQATGAPQPRQQALTPADVRRELATALNQKIHSAFSMAKPAEAMTNRTAMQQSSSIGLQQSLQQQGPPPQPQGLHSAQPASSMQRSCQQGSMQSCPPLAGNPTYPAIAATLPMCQTPQPSAASPEAIGAAYREGAQISLSMPGFTLLAGTLQQYGAQSAVPSGQAEQHEMNFCPAGTSRAIARAQQPGSRAAGPTVAPAVTATVSVPEPLLRIPAMQPSAHAHAAPPEPMSYAESVLIPTPPQRLQPEALLAPDLLRQSDTL